MYHIIGFYIFILLVLSIFYDELKNSKFLLFFITFFLFVLASIRFNIGTDYPAYNNFFIYMKPFNLDWDYSTNYEHLEPLFRYTIAILKIVIKSPIFYFSFWAFISLFFIWKGISKLSENYLLSIFIFYCIFYHHYIFNTIRQGVVMGIFLFSTQYILKKKILPTLLISIVSSLIHSSGLLILFAYFISNINIRKRIILISILVISIIFWKLGIGEILFIRIIKLLPDFLIPNLVVYVRLFYSNLSVINVLQRLFILLPLIYLYPKFSDNDKFIKLFSIYYLGNIIYLTFGFFSLFITRINMFFRILEVILIPIIYEGAQSKKQKFIVLFIIMSWCFAVLSWVYSKETYYPFKTIFGDVL